MTFLDKAAEAVAGSRTMRHLVGKLANAEWFQPVAEMLQHRVPIGLATLARCGLKPDTVVDIGAYVGDWTLGALPYFPMAKFVMIEAQPEKLPILRDVAARGRIEAHSCLLGRTEQEAVPFILNETGSSIYPDHTAFKPQGQVALQMRTLDGLLAGEKGRLFLKLDVQGAELDVLAGGASIIAQVDAVLLEVSIVEFNIGTPRIAEVLGFMRERGFEVFDIVDHRRIGAVLAQVDLIFVRAGSEIAGRAQSHISNYGR